MAGPESTHQSIRKVLGSIKDSTTVGLAKVNSDYKDLDIAIVKATNHDEQLAKDKYIQIIFNAVSKTKPRVGVQYCISSLARRLAKTRNWAVAIKTLIVVHRALREVDSSFHEEILRYTKRHGHILNLSHFKDDFSPNAWDYSAWVRTYALYLEERLECFRVLKYDVEKDRSKISDLDTPELLEDLSALQQLLFRLLACQPEGSSIYNIVIRYALSMVAGESIKICSTINDGTQNLVDKFFEMQRHEAIRALEIYRKVGHQGESLPRFYEICRSHDLVRNLNFVRIDQPLASFTSAMEEYVKDGLISAANRNVVDAARLPAPMPVLALENKKFIDDHAENTPVPVEAPVLLPDLLDLGDANHNATDIEDRNGLALAIVDNDSSLLNSTSPDHINGTSGWELALVGASSSKGGAVAESQLAGGFDRLVLDSLYDNAMAQGKNKDGEYHRGQVALNPFEVAPHPQDPFYASNNVAPPTNVQMATMAQQQTFMMQQHQQHMLGHDSANPFDNPFGTLGAPPSYPSQNQHAGFI